MVSIWDMLKVRGQNVQGTKKQFSIIDPSLLCPTPNPTPMLGLQDISSLYIIHIFFSPLTLVLKRKAILVISFAYFFYYTI